MMRGMMMSAILFVAVGAGLAPGGEDPARVAKDIQGEWEGVSLEIAGEEAPEEDAKAFRVAIRPGEMSFMTCRGDRCVERKKEYKLDPAKSPMRIDLTTLDGQEEGTTQLGIFSLKGDDLKLCVPLFEHAPSGRPAEFKTKPGDGRGVIVLRRVAAK